MRVITTLFFMLLLLLLLLSATTWSAGPARAQVGTVEQQTAPEEPAIPELPGICAVGALQHNIPVPPACPEPGRTTRIWSVECNPICYTTTHAHAHTTTGYCLDISEEIPYSPPVWRHCGHVPAVQLVTLGGEFRTKGANGYGYMWLPAGGYRCGLSYWISSSYCSNCDVDVWECLEDPLLISTKDASYELTDTKGGVRFDLNGDGQPEQIPWTAGRDDAFLVLDRNGNGLIDDGGSCSATFHPSSRAVLRTASRRSGCSTTL